MKMEDHEFKFPMFGFFSVEAFGVEIEVLLDVFSM